MPFVSLKESCYSSFVGSKIVLMMFHGSTMKKGRVFLKMWPKEVWLARIHSFVQPSFAVTVGDRKLCKPPLVER